MEPVEELSVYVVSRLRALVLVLYDVIRLDTHPALSATAC